MKLVVFAVRKFIHGAIAIAALYAATQPADAADALTNPLAGDAAAARQGEDLFGRNCQQCHNSRGKGGKGPQLVRGAWGPGGANSDAYMFGIVSNGRPNTQMGGFGQALSDTEIWQIIAFLRSEAVRVKASEKAKSNDPPVW